MTGGIPADVATGFDALASDGGVVRIRPVRPADEAELLDFHRRASERSFYLRFFAHDRTGAEKYVRHLANAEPADRHAVLVAESGGRIIAVAGFEPMSADEAEIAFLVDDAHHGRGIGTLLLEHLAATARARGIRRFHADTLAVNLPMMRVFADSGFAHVREREGSVVEIALDTAYDESTLDRIAERERLAEDLSLRPVLAPRTVAVIGAGREPGGIGHEVLVNLVGGGFTGRVFAVNPHADAVAGVLAYPTIGDVPERVELAVIAVPAAQVLDVVAQCGAAGVAGAVVVTSGFGETGGEGAAAQRELVRLAREHGMRVIGPNCIGVVNTASDVRLNATFTPVSPRLGSLALASQSGAVGIAVLDHATRSGLGVSDFVSLGNKADVSGNDLLLHWWGDPRTDVIALYLESFGNPRKFGRLARLVGRTKPVLVVKGGRSSGGRRAGASHTAAAATPDTAVDALFAQAGVIRLDTLEELLDVARVLAGQPLPAGRRIAVVGNAGGAGVLAADAAEAAGLEVPQLSEQTRAALAYAAPGAAGIDNPVDLGAAARPEVLEAAVRILAESAEIDALIVTFAVTRTNQLDQALAAIAAAAEDADIPVAVNCLGAPGDTTQVGLSGGRTLPVFPFPESAVHAIGHAARYARWRDRPRGRVPALPGADVSKARAVVDGFLSDRGGGWADGDTAAELARCFGLPVAVAEPAGTIEDAVSAAARVGYPVAVKTAAAVHKTDVGGVRLDVRDEAELRAAYAGVAEATDDARVVVQHMVEAGVEMVVGVVHEPSFGPVVMLGAGGVLTDLLDDRAWRGLPLTDVDAAEMVQSLRAARLLAGFRGAPPADVTALTDVLHRVALLAQELPEVAELDVNPLIVHPHGAVAVDIKIRLDAASVEPDPYVRRLR